MAYKNLFVQHQKALGYIGFSVRGNTSQWLTIPTNQFVKPVTGVGAISGSTTKYGFNVTDSGQHAHNSGHFNKSEGTFTAPCDGYYFFAFKTHSNVRTNSDYSDVRIYINGSLVQGSLEQGGYYFTVSSTDAEYMSSTSIIVFLNTNDYVECFLRNPGGNVRYYGDYYRFSGHLLG